MEKLENTKENKKQVRKYIRLGLAALLVLLLAVMPMVAAGRSEAETNQASILSAAVEAKTIDSQIIGGGQLSSEASLSVKIPEHVKLTQYLVGNGDTVKEGEVIARVDKVSVMTAITQVQETLDYLAEEIADASDDTASTRVKALSGGTVKVIYATEGESVQDVMLDHGALAILSLDDTMAVKLERSTDLDVGDAVCVAFSDGTEADGRVKSNLDGVLTVTVADKDYSVGEKVTVTTEDGNRLGTGELYIFSPWSATAYSGTVGDILVEENDTVYIGQTLLSLEDTGNTAQFQRLIDQRQEYEELMQELFAMYRTETITAPCDGIITGVDEDGVWLLSGNGGSWFANLLSFSGREEKSGFMAYGAEVTRITEDGMQLLLNPAGIRLEDLSALSGISADLSAMTESCNYIGSTRVYIQQEDGLLTAAGNARVGDLLLAVGDRQQVRWFVMLSGSEETPAAAQTGQKTGNTFAFMLSETDAPADVCTGDSGCTAENHNDGCPLKEVTGGETGGGIDGENDGEDDGDDSGDGGDAPAISITTSGLNQGVAGQPYTSPLQATDGTNVLAGIWAASGLPAGLSIDPNTGVISGTPTAAGNYPVTISFAWGDTPAVKEFTLVIVDAAQETETYLGYVARVTEVADGAMKVMQTACPCTVTDLNNLPQVAVDETALTQEATYVSPLVSEATVAVNDYLLIVVDQEGTLKHFAKYQAPASGGQTDTPDGGTGSIPGGTIPSGGAVSGGMIMGGMGQVQTFEPYSLNKLTVASVTSQEHMTVSVMIDELDITKIYVGQKAIVSVDALGGEQFEAEITRISNSGENAGGNSKFAVEVSLAKSGEMLPGMYASAWITLETNENVPCVPVAALNKDGADTIVYTGYNADSGILENPVVVTIGCSDGENVEILAGLQLGEICYYEYYDTYTGSDDAQQGGFSMGAMPGGRK